METTGGRSFMAETLWDASIVSRLWHHLTINVHEIWSIFSWNLVDYWGKSRDRPCQKCLVIPVTTGIKPRNFPNPPEGYPGDVATKKKCRKDSAMLSLCIFLRINCYIPMFDNVWCSYPLDELVPVKIRGRPKSIMLKGLCVCVRGIPLHVQKHPESML